MLQYKNKKFTATPNKDQENNSDFVCLCIRRRDAYPRRISSVLTRAKLIEHLTHNPAISHFARVSVINFATFLQTLSKYSFAFTWSNFG